MSKHTPGPWHFQRNRIDRTGDFEFAVFSGTEEEKLYPGMLKWIIGGKGETSPLSEADARLIAAAPELLEACKQARKEILSAYAQEAEYLKQAIEKAEGKK